MAGSKTTAFSNNLLNDLLRGVALSLPGTLYVALFTVAPTDAGGGTEVTGGSYARAAVSRAGGTWDAASGGATANTSTISFTTASASWGTVVAFAIMDASSGGNMLYWGDLTTPKAIGSGDTAQFAAGELDITET
jgi:hypothetical protein